jgi:hypothetical protein
MTFEKGVLTWKYQKQLLNNENSALHNEGMIKGAVLCNVATVSLLRLGRMGNGEVNKITFVLPAVVNLSTVITRPKATVKISNRIA